jgi:phosphoribosylanthranilate isomerase
MFQIKICGITTPEDALLAAEAGAGAIGLNLYELSPRYVLPTNAAQISRAVRAKYRFGNPRILGVFVNTPELLRYEIAEISEIDGYQLHGDEPPEDVVVLNMGNSLGRPSFFDRLVGVPDPLLFVVRAFRCSDASLSPVADYLRACLDLKYCEDAVTLPHAVLLDAHQPGAYGGTGQVVDWPMIRNEREKLLGLPLILAGGLTPDNVAEAIATARPDAVDVASGVESSPGKKDPAKVRAFVAAAKEAFDALDKAGE